MFEDPTRAKYETMLRQDFTTFAARCFYDLNPQTDLAMNWHLEVIAAKLAAVRQGKIRRLIINLPPRGLNSLKSLQSGGHGWKIGWKILFSHRSGHPSPLDSPPASGRQRASWSGFSGCIAPWW
jgi:hypothetical protein